MRSRFEKSTARLAMFLMVGSFWLAGCAGPTTSEEVEAKACGKTVLVYRVEGEGMVARTVGILRRRLAEEEEAGTVVVAPGAGVALEVRLEQGISAEEERRIRRLVESRGEFAMWFVARDEDGVERGKLERWWNARSDAAGIETFNDLAGKPEGPSPGFSWVPMSEEFELEVGEYPGLPRFLGCLLLRDEAQLGHPEWVFDEGDLAEVYATSDRQGRSAMGFRMREARAEAFGDATEYHEGRPLAIVLDGRVVSAPVVRSRLPGAGIIQGFLDSEETSAWLRILRSGALPAGLTFVEKRP